MQFIRPLTHLCCRTLSTKPAVILFPGQGSQYVGMVDKYLSAPGSTEIFEIARESLGYDLLKLCREGPEKVLRLTYYCQPAVVATSLVALKYLQHTNPEVFTRCVATAGFSVGELTSLAFSGALSLEDTFSIVKVRAKSMHDASIDPPSGMINIQKLDVNEIESICLKAEDKCRKEGVLGVAVIGNYLFPKSVSVSGTVNALAIVSELASSAGGKVKRVNVAGAFHSPLMTEASLALRRVLVGTPMGVPKIPVYSNVTGTSYQDPYQLKELFTKQLQMSVRWNSLVQNLLSDYGDDLEFYEVGPSRHISSMILHINRKCKGNVYSTET